MASYNKVYLMGNLTRDPQVKHLPSSTTVAEFGVAVNRRYRTAAGEDKEEVAFIDCTAFGRQAETIAQYMTKGKPIFIEGRLKWDSWQDKSTNSVRSKITVVVENFQFLGQRNADEGEPQDDGDRRAIVTGVRERQASHRGRLDKPAPVFNQMPGKPKSETVAAPFDDNDQQFQEADIPF